MLGLDMCARQLIAIRRAVVLTAALPTVGLFLLCGRSVAQTPNSLPNSLRGYGDWHFRQGRRIQFAARALGDLGVSVGGEPGYIGDGCPPNQAVLSAPTTTAIDPQGNLYFTDQNHFAVRVLYQGGSALQTFIVDAYNKKTVITAASLVPGYIYQFCGPYVGMLGGQQDGGHACNDFNVGGRGMALDPAGQRLCR